MYLETSPTSSVHVDVAPDDNDVAMVMLETEQVNYDAYNVFHKSLPVTGEGCSVATVLDVLIMKKRDVYRFAPVGEGCRYWLSIVVLDLADAGLVNRGDAQDAVDGLGCIGVFLVALAHLQEKLYGVLFNFSSDECTSKARNEEP